MKDICLAAGLGVTEVALVESYIEDDDGRFLERMLTKSSSLTSVTSVTCHLGSPRRLTSSPTSGFLIGLLRVS